MLAQRYKVLAKCGGRGGLCFTSHDLKYKLVTSKSGSRESLKLFEALVSTCDCVEEELDDQAPTTPAAWVRCVQFIQDAFKKSYDAGLRVPCLSPVPVKGKLPYLFTWTCRCLLLCRMRKNGIQQLRKVSDVSFASFAASFPDAKQNFARLLGTRRRTISLREFFDEICYKGPWELSSMVWCFTTHDAFDTITAVELQERIKELKAARATYKKKWGQNPHPATLVRNAVAVDA